MTRENVPISTGVDGLVKIVRDRGRIELREAAVELGISQGVLEEWARVLEKEDILKIDYQFTKVYLSLPTTETSQVKKKAKDIADMQVTMEREVESQVKRLERIGRELDDMREEFIGVSQVFEDKMAGVRRRVRDLDAVEKQYEEICFRCRCASERFVSDIESLKRGIEESEKKLEKIQKMKEELDKDMKAYLEFPKSEKK